jgi:hypothetical protein
MKVSKEDSAGESIGRDEPNVQSLRDTRSPTRGHPSALQTRQRSMNRGVADQTPNAVFPNQEASFSKKSRDCHSTGTMV